MGVSGAIIRARATKEVTWGVFNAAAVAADQLWMEIQGGDSFAMDAVPQHQEMRSNVGGNHRRKRVGPRKLVDGSFRTALFPSQVAFLMGWVTDVVTVGLNKYTPSWTIDFFDGVTTGRALGCRCKENTGESNSGTDILNTTFTIWGKEIIWGTPALASFADPGITAYPAEHPYVHQHSAPHLILNGTTYQDGYRSLAWRIVNDQYRGFDALATVSSIDYNGRDVDWTAIKEYVNTEFLTLHQNNTPFAASAAWHYPWTPAVNFTLNFRDNNYVATRPITRNFSEKLYETINGQSFLSPTTGDILAFTTVGP